MAKVASKAAAKPAAKKAAGPARGSKKKVKAGERYSCEVCGLVVSVDEVCGCVDACDIICCGEQMRPGR
jgi:rubrerythrin